MLEIEVTDRPNGLEAISKTEVLRADLILMVLMFGIASFEATKRSPRNPGLQNIPIIGVTAILND
jgi:CheY-like chemotaxis protein